MTDISPVAAFIAGLLIFFVPCTFPLVPGYLGFISGISLEDLKDPLKVSSVRRKILLNSFFFIVGFSAVFVIMGTLVGFVGAQLLAPYRLWWSRIGGGFVVVFGVFMLNVIKPPRFWKEKHLTAPVIFERGHPINSFIFGSTLALGWTPCVGPILGSILLLASTSATAYQGAFILTIFSAGLAVPFFLIAAGIGSASGVIVRVSKYLNAISFVGGMFLIFLGLLLMTGNMGLLMSYSYQLLRFIDYERLLDYL